MFECESVSEIRNTHWKKVLDSCPDALVRDIGTLSNQRKTDMVMNAMNNSYVKEWIELFRNIADMIHAIWNSYTCNT